MAGSLDNEEVHLVAIPAGFQFLVFFMPGDTTPLAVLRRSSVCSMDDAQIAAVMRGCAAEMEAGSVRKKPS